MISGVSSYVTLCSGYVLFVSSASILWGVAHLPLHMVGGAVNQGVPFIPRTPGHNTETSQLDYSILPNHLDWFREWHVTQAKPIRIFFCQSHPKATSILEFPSLVSLQNSFLAEAILGFLPLPLIKSSVILPYKNGLSCSCFEACLPPTPDSIALKQEQEKQQSKQQ